MARLAVMMNAELRRMVADLKGRLVNVHHVRLEYSEALTNVDFSRLELINDVDGWHPSIEGHKVLAEAAFKGLRPSLVFLKIGTGPTRKTPLLAGNDQERKFREQLSHRAAPGTISTNSSRRSRAALRQSALAFEVRPQ